MLLARSSQYVVSLCCAWEEAKLNLFHTDIPHAKILRNPAELISALPPSTDAYFICRRGNDSLLDARIAQSNLVKNGYDGRVYDVRGGLQAWNALHPDFPLY